jgi:hypothetical protein
MKAQNKKSPLKQGENINDRIFDDAAADRSLPDHLRGKDNRDNDTVP